MRIRSIILLRVYHMNRNRALLILGALLLQSCSIAYYDLRNEIKGPEKPKSSCIVKYSINITGGLNSNMFGFIKIPKNRLGKMEQKFVAITHDVLASKGCEDIYVPDKNDATLEIQIREAAVSPPPQGWITYNTFGVVPSWSTTPSVYIYVFDDKPSGRSHTYTVDMTLINHLIFLPVFWISFFTADESRLYQNALNNFLDHS